jgi:hypothetical protein
MVCANEIQSARDPLRQMHLLEVALRDDRILARDELTADDVGILGDAGRVRDAGAGALEHVDSRATWSMYHRLSSLLRGRCT